MKKRTITKIAAIAAVATLAVGTLAGCGCDHEWAEATCTTPKTCVNCEEVEGEALGHIWQEANCEAPKTCTQCGKTEGEALGHTVKDWKVTKKSTCVKKGTKEGACTVCGETVKESLKLGEHTPGDWKVTKEATASSAGEKTKSCTVCKEVLDTKEFKMSAAEIKKAYIKKCKDGYTYEKIARNPDKYKGDYVKIRGEVIQSMEDGNDYTLRVNITPGSYYWSDPILVSYTKQSSSESRILEDDIVVMYGKLAGTYTYETVMGNDVTVPLLFAEYIEVQ